MQELQALEAGADAGSEAFGPLGRTLLWMAKAMAVIGGLIFTAVVAMSLVSIVGRKLFSWAVPGDMEVLQMCAAFAAASFFAYCHLIHGDVKVDFFTANMARRKVLALDAVGSLLIAAFGALLTWRTWVGAMAIREVGETSPILGWPVWVAQALMVPGFILLAAAGLYMACHHLAAMREARQ